MDVTLNLYIIAMQKFKEYIGCIPMPGVTKTLESRSIYIF